MTVKLLVIYPRPNVEAFETVYDRDHVPMAVEKFGRQDEDCGEQNSRFPTRDTNLPSDCRDPFPLFAKR